MYRIAIGDDDPRFLEAAAATAAACMDADGLERGADYEIDVYPEAQPLLNALRQDKDRYQLLLLDIDFGGENGLALAARLREELAEFSLIYVSNYRDYVFDSFDTRPLHYLLKPLDGEKLGSLLREDYRGRADSARLFLKAGGKRLSLAYRDIYAVESAQHRVLFHLREETAEWNSPLVSLAPELPKQYFCRCHNSYYVNLAHVTELVRYEARLDDGRTVPVSKQFYKSAIEQYFAYLRH